MPGAIRSHSAVSGAFGPHVYRFLVNLSPFPGSPRRRRKNNVRRTPGDLLAVRAAFDQELSKLPNHEIQAAADQKRVYCKLLRQLGGLTTDDVGREIRKLLPKGHAARPYDLRRGVTQCTSQGFGTWSCAT